MTHASALAVALVKAFGDPDAIGKLLTEDAEWWITPTVGVLGSPTVGREQIIEAMRVIFGQMYADAAAVVHMAIGEGDLGAVRITLNAKALFAGGRPYENEYSVWIRRDGDRISRVWEYLDVAQATAQFS
jgi:ketosteroid isomerase-like protein